MHIDETLADDLFDLGSADGPRAPIEESLADDLFDLGSSQSRASSRANESPADDLFNLGDSDSQPSKASSPSEQLSEDEDGVDVP